MDCVEGLVASAAVDVAAERIPDRRLMDAGRARGQGPTLVVAACRTRISVLGATHEVAQNRDPWLRRMDRFGGFVHVLVTRPGASVYHCRSDVGVHGGKRRLGMLQMDPAKG